jgi:hypothetical protein
MKVLLTGGFALRKYYLQVVFFKKVLLTGGFALRKYYLQVVLL